MDELRPLSDTDSRDPLARLVRHARGLEVTYDVEAGLARHGRIVAEGAATATPGVLAKWGLGGLATAIFAAGWLASQSGSQVAAQPASRVSAPSDAIASSPSPVIAAAPGVVTNAAVAALPARTSAPPTATASVPPGAPPSPLILIGRSATGRTPRRATRREPIVIAQPGSDPSANAEPDDRIAREAAQIRQIRGDLAAGRAAAAFRGCDAGNAEFADGVFALEREGLRVLALFAIGRRDDADRAAVRYLDAHPDGPLVAKIRAARGT